MIHVGYMIFQLVGFAFAFGMLMYTLKLKSKTIGLQAGHIDRLQTTIKNLDDRLDSLYHRKAELEAVNQRMDSALNRMSVLLQERSVLRVDSVLLCSTRNACTSYTGTSQQLDETLRTLLVRNGSPSAQLRLQGGMLLKLQNLRQYESLLKNFGTIQLTKKSALPSHRR